MKPDYNPKLFFEEAPHLRVAVLSLDIVEGEVEVNLDRTGKMLESLPDDTDLAVLPEMFTTSFMQNTEELLRIGESAAARTQEALVSWAAVRRMAIAGSFIAKAPEGYVNRGFLISPAREMVCYDKRHLFCLSPEAKLLSAGKGLPPVVNFRGWNISMIVCYDLRFPVWNRNVGQQTDILLVPANWPRSRGYAWRQLLIARAIENQEYVVGANRGGEDSYGVYDGLSMIIDPLGVPVVPEPAERPDDSPEPMVAGETILTDYGTILTARLSLEKLRRLRKRLPVGLDADRFIIHDAF